MSLRLITDHEIDGEMQLMGEAASIITPLSEFQDAVIAHMDSQPNDSGDKLPWSKTHDSLRLRPAEISIWTGISGHGKTGFLNQIIGSLLGNCSVVVASLEMRPEETVLNMIKQVAGCYPSKKFVESWIEAHKYNLWLYDQTNQVAPERILAMARYSSRVLKAKHIVIDSLMKCGLNEDDYNAQKILVDRLAWVAKEFGPHIHLVAHSRKSENEYKIPGKFDVSGSASITNLADNVFVVYRNKRREEELEKKKMGLCFNDGEIAKPATRLKVCKNRHGGAEPMFGFYFHEASGQFTSSDGKTLPCNFIPDGATS
ncbi:AAA family ATPase [Pseudomonadales bacterium]|nr:AAA family ATPase [Pseudomonadales bacterium]